MGFASAFVSWEDKQAMIERAKEEIAALEAAATG